MEGPRGLGRAGKVRVTVHEGRRDTLGECGAGAAPSLLPLPRALGDTGSGSPELCSFC